MGGPLPTVSPTISDVAIVGAGVIGRSWAQVFVRAGCHTALFDTDPGQLKRAVLWIEKDLETDCVEGVIDQHESEARLARLTPCTDLREALGEALYVQESGPEETGAKKQIFSDLDHYAKPEAILCSSTSGLRMTELAAGLACAGRSMVAHPVNPPHIIPVVELVPGLDTDAAIVLKCREFLSSVGQMPVLLHSEVAGFLLNRLQAALFCEAIHLISTGRADLKDVETVVSEGLGLRWALLGPFGVASTNVEGGLPESLTRFRQTYLDLMNDLGPASTLPPDLVDSLSREMSQLEGATDRALIRTWRDRMVRKIQALKVADPHP